MNSDIIVYCIVHDVDCYYIFTCSSSNFGTADSPVLADETDKEIVFEWLRNEYSDFGRVCFFLFSFLLHMGKESAFEWLRNEFLDVGRMCLSPPPFFCKRMKEIVFED